MQLNYSPLLERPQIRTGPRIPVCRQRGPSTFQSMAMKQFTHSKLLSPCLLDALHLGACVLFAREHCALGHWMEGPSFSLSMLSTIPTDLVLLAIMYAVPLLLIRFNFDRSNHPDFWVILELCLPVCTVLLAVGHLIEESNVIAVLIGALAGMCGATTIAVYEDYSRRPKRHRKALHQISWLTAGVLVCAILHVESHSERFILVLGSLAVCLAVFDHHLREASKRGAFVFNPKCGRG